MYYRVEAIEVSEHDLTGVVSEDFDVERFYDLRDEDIERVGSVRLVNVVDSKASAELEIKSLSEQARYTPWPLEADYLYRCVDSEYLHPRFGYTAVWYRFIREA